MKKIFSFLLVCSVFVSCFPIKIPSRIKNNVVCNEGHYTGLDTLINTKGIYYYVSSVSSQEKDTFYSCFMFWNDGTVVSIGRQPNEIQPFFDNILSKNKKKHKEFYLNCWGNYRIIDSTIICQFIYVPYFISLEDSWYGGESSYKIIDKNKLEYLPMMSKSLDPRVNKNEYYNNVRQRYIEENNGITAVFMSIERIPLPNCWLKKKKWFWCNEEDWKEYNRKIKK